MSFTTVNQFHVPKEQRGRWAIPNLLSPGLTLLTGETRSGKTSLAYQLMMSVGAGQSALDGTSEFTATPGTVFYLGLDLSASRLDDMRLRFQAACPDTTLPGNVMITNTWHALTPEEGLKELRGWFDLYPDKRLLVIDNLVALRTLFKVWWSHLSRQFSTKFKIELNHSRNV
jgi:hypothetical protein